MSRLVVQPDLLMPYDIRLGQHQIVLPNEECDVLFTDGPFSEKTHEGHNRARSKDKSVRAKIGYDFWTRDHVFDFVRSWSPRTRGWMICLTDDILATHYREAYRDVGRLDFQPVPCIIPGMTVRQQGDGPSSWAVYALIGCPIYAMVGRPRKRLSRTKLGTKPGWYQATRGGKDDKGGGRGKPPDLIRQILADYSDPGDVVCDPCMGFGTHLEVALSMGRRAMGAEIDPAAFATAKRRCALVQYVDLLAYNPRKAKQPSLIDVPKRAKRRPQEAVAKVG